MVLHPWSNVVAAIVVAAVHPWSNVVAAVVVAAVVVVVMRRTLFYYRKKSINCMTYERNFTLWNLFFVGVVSPPQQNHVHSWGTRPRKIR